MATAGAVIAARGLAPRRTGSTAVGSAPGGERHFVCEQIRMSVADVAAELRALEHDLWSVSPLVPAGGVGASDGRTAPRRAERQRQGRATEPSAGCVDSQSIKTATQGTAVGFDGGKLVKGRKRHLLVDTLGLIVAVVVTAANGGDREGLQMLVSSYFADGVKRLRKLWVDGGYSGEPLRRWVAGLKASHKIDLEVVEHHGPGFQLVKRRWVVERTFSWLLNYRRHSRDYEVRITSSEGMIQISMIHLLLKRLA